MDIIIIRNSLPKNLNPKQQKPNIISPMMIVICNHYLVSVILNVTYLANIITRICP
jgi:hypothetical protein